MSKEKNADILKGKILEIISTKYPERLKEYYEQINNELSNFHFINESCGYQYLEYLIYIYNNNIKVSNKCNSATAYAMGITDVSPNGLMTIVYGKSMPDIDVDVCKEKRGQLIQYISDKYGQDSVAQIITFGRMKGKGTIRAIGRVLDVPDDDVEYLSSIMPPDAQEFTISLTQIIEEDDEVPKDLVNKFKQFMSKSEKNKEYIEACVRLEGTYRTSGVHAAGIVIGPEPLRNIIPLRQSKDGGTVTQFSMEEVEALGLLKFDLLGLDTLSMVTQCLSLINGNEKLKDEGPLKGTEFKTFRDLLPLLGKMDDKKVYEETFSKGSTLGIFQCDSSGIRELLARMKAFSFNDISAAIALYRPGPLDSGITESFIQRRNKNEKETVWVESARKYMSDTHGLPIYQEQIMFISRELCGFSLQEADDLRKIIGKKRKEEIQKFREKFVKAAVEHSKITELLGNEIYNDIEKFGKYGFNRSHSAAYAAICYVTAWLKTYYPAQFMASLLQKFVATEVEKANDSKVVKKKDDEKILIYFWETQRLGINILAPDITTSNYSFEVIDNNTLKFGLGCIKGVGPKLKTLLEARQRNNGFKNFVHFIAMAIDCGLTSRTIIDLDKAQCLTFPVSKEDKERVFEGYYRPCRCVKARGTVKPDCKNCSGSGLGKTKRTIFDDIRTFTGKTQQEFDEFIEDINPPITADTSTYKILNSPDVYVIDKYVKSK
jgi:DNA polymerase-3 subunit alpha